MQNFAVIMASRIICNLTVLFSLFRLITNIHQSTALLSLREEKPLVDCPYKWSGMRISFWNFAPVVIGPCTVQNFTTIVSLNGYCRLTVFRKPKKFEIFVSMSACRFAVAKFLWCMSGRFTCICERFLLCVHMEATILNGSCDEWDHVVFF